MVPNTVKKLTNTSRTAEYYFSSLPCSTISACQVREVILTGSGITETDGIISGYDTISPVGEGEIMSVATTTGGASQTFTYTASYTQEEPTGAVGNIQNTIITNTRPGFTIEKEDFEGNKLAGAKFTLSKSDGTVIGNFTSDGNGFVAMGYFDNNTNYILEETKAPSGYYAVNNTYLFSVDNAGVVDYTNGAVDGMVIDNTNKVITIKNKALNLTIRKQDSNSHEPLEGAVFSIYKNVGGYIDINPIQGYSNLTSNANGIILNLNKTSLPQGNYFLKEITAPSNYKKLTSVLGFSVSDNGDYVFTESDDVNIETSTNSTERIININVYNTYSTVTTNNLTLQKTVSGNLGNKSQYFKFQIDITGTSQNAQLTLPIILTNASQQTSTKTDDGQVHQNPTSITLDSSGHGTAYVWLSHNESIEIDGLPLNIDVDVIETNRDYSPSIEITSGGTTSTISSADTNVLTITDATTIKYTNTKQGSVVTGNYIWRFMTFFNIIFIVGVVNFIIKKET